MYKKMVYFGSQIVIRELSDNVTMQLFLLSIKLI